ncbi:MAG: hypothetical protein AUI14_13515 [Actinobacteria bacterium 13_2_20CM_2_71_6]|nr:MAG: hypothetical protein AUI14_13515 [Actinobacteria bacterium 13_2_20CM_2_71_6]
MFGPPDFAGLAAWPALQRVVAERWPEGDAWHSRRKGAGLLHLRREITRQQREPPVVRDVERQLRRRVPPFELELVLLPVRDEEIRPVGEAKYLVPEAVYDGPGWAAWLRAVVTRLAS